MTRLRRERASRDRRGAGPAGQEEPARLASDGGLAIDLDLDLAFDLAASAGYHTVTPYLIVAGASRLIEFLTAAFDASPVISDDAPRRDRSVTPRCRIGDSKVMLSEAPDGHPADAVA